METCQLIRNFFLFLAVCVWTLCFLGLCEDYQNKSPHKINILGYGLQRLYCSLGLGILYVSKLYLQMIQVTVRSH